MLMVNHLSGFGASNQDSSAFVYYDEFDGAATTLASHTSDSGHTYTKSANTTDNAVTAATDGSGKLANVTPALWSCYYVNSLSLGTGDTFVIYPTIGTTAGNFHGIGICFAWTDSAANEYSLIFDVYKITTTTVRLEKRVNGTGSLITSLGLAGMPTTISIVKLSDGTYDLYYDSTFWTNVNPTTQLGTVGANVGYRMYTSLPDVAKILRMESA